MKLRFFKVGQKEQKRGPSGRVKLPPGVRAESAVNHASMVGGVSDVTHVSVVSGVSDVIHSCIHGGRSQ
jgi:hypothetical protein